VLGSNGKLNLEQLIWCMANGVDPSVQVLVNRVGAIFGIGEPATPSQSLPAAQVDPAKDDGKFEMGNIGKALPTVFVGRIPKVSCAARGRI
jgi:hypothetical protein